MTDLEKQIRELIERGGYSGRSSNQVAMLERFAGEVIELLGKQAEPVAFVDANGDLIAKTKLAPWTNLYTHPAQPVQSAGAQGDVDDSLLLCASDLEHSAIYDNHAEMQECIRAVAQRIKALGQPAPAAAINEQLLEALKELMYARTDKAEGMAEAAIAAAEAAKKGGV